jgi:hypothetical protein
LQSASERYNSPIHAASAPSSACFPRPSLSAVRALFATHSHTAGHALHTPPLVLVSEAPKKEVFLALRINDNLAGAQRGCTAHAPEFKAHT